MVHSFAVYLLYKQGATGATLRNLTLTKMNTIAEFIENLEKNDIPYYVGMRTNRYGQECWSIGIATHGGDVFQWFTFTYDPFMDTPQRAEISDLWQFENCGVEFEQRYSCQTGSVFKSGKYRREILTALREGVFPKSMHKRGRVHATTIRNNFGLIANCA